MAYVNLVNEVLTGSTEAEKQAEIFMRFRDFVCKRNATYDYSYTGIGWTLYDSSYAVDEDNAAVNDWFVISSTGELGRDKMYFEVKLTTNYITIHGWQSWNAISHVGVGNSYYRDNAWQIGTLPISLYIYGDLDFVHPIIAGIAGNTNWTHGCFGLLDDSFLVPLEGAGFKRNVQVCSSALSAGSDVPIVVPDSSSGLWAPGCHLMIMDDEEIERILVKTNNGTTTITADLTNSYAAGARISVFFPYYITNSYNYNWPGRAGYSSALHDTLGNIGPTTMTHFDTSTFGLSLLSGTGWGSCYGGIPKGIQRHATTGEGPLGIVPHAVAASAVTGLTHEDLLDDITDPAVKWRYCSSSIGRYYKEV